MLHVTIFYIWIDSEHNTSQAIIDKSSSTTNHNAIVV